MYACVALMYFVFRAGLSEKFDDITSALDPELVGEVLKVVESLAVEGMTLFDAPQTAELKQFLSALH